MKPLIILLGIWAIPAMPSFSFSETSPQVKQAEENSGKVEISELSANPKKYEGKVVKIEGRLIQEAPTYFPRPRFAITNGVDKIPVSAWLPITASPMPPGSKKMRGSLMSDMINKQVAVSGKVVVENGNPMIEVTNGKILE